MWRKLLEETKWIHEQLNVLDALKIGQADELIKFLLEGGVPNNDLLAVIERYLEDGEFSWNPLYPKVGRRHSNKWDEWTCIGLYRAKKEFLEKYPDKRVIDIEGMMEQSYATNIDDLRKNINRGKNILMTGPAGCGKTMAAKSLVNSLDRADFYFNLGATQDPRSTLIGNTHFDSKKGTYFAESHFVKAIQTPNSVILLDELSRAHPDAWNILMTVLDQGQRYLRLDEADGQATIKVADGVCFVATANIGNEYTATRQLDKALLDRFTVIEMDLLSDEEEHGLLSYLFPTVDSDVLGNVAKIAFMTRSEAATDNPRISSGVSTRTSVEIAGLLFDGFSLEESADITIYPQYDADGGVDSERTFVKQIVQKFVDDGSNDDLI